MSILTQIPLTEFNQIVQTNSSPETIAALLNEAESSYSSTPKHWNAKRVYPFWRACRKCGQPFAVANVAELYKKTTCGAEYCRKATGARPHMCKTLEQRKGQWVACAVCGKRAWKSNSWLRRTKAPTCSRQCNGTLRGAEFAKHAHKGRAAWTEESERSYREKMTGPNNPAWKGGVTYFKTHGNYVGVKYVRCPAEFLPMARKDGYVMEHRLIVAQLMGRCLKRSEVVHHEDHNPTNNDPHNLMLFASNTAHKKHEATGNPPPLWRL